MDYMDFKKMFSEKLEIINEDIDEKILEKFYNYKNLLQEWNEKINLTAIVDDEEIIVKHFIDSLTINKYVKDTTSIIDVGTGAGFPGIPIKLVNKDIQCVLLDSLNKRINFLNEVIKKCEIENIVAVHQRVEEYAINNRERFDIATSRAVARLVVLLEYLLPLIRVGGKCICMKGSNCKEEILESEKALKILGGKIEKVENFTLPDNTSQRTIIIVKKIKKSPDKYPRKAGIPTKNPLI